MKLQRQKAYVYRSEDGEEIEHYKHLVTIPDEAVETLGWKQGIELRPAIEGSKLILEPESSKTAKTDITPKRRVRGQAL